MNELSSDAPSMAVISGTETLDAPLDHPRDEGEDRTNLLWEGGKEGLLEEEDEEVIME